MGAPQPHGAVGGGAALRARAPTAIANSCTPHALDATLSLVADQAIIGDQANVFFSSLGTKLAAFVVGNVLAVVVFSLLSQKLTASVAAEVEEAKGAPARPLSLVERISSLSPGAFLTLLLSLAIDLAGDSSFVLPGIGEAEDAVWAPLSGLMLKVIFGSNAIAGLDFAKEALPFTDVLPVATLAWACKNLYPESSVSKALGLSPQP
mmetsp:Transcript_21903/g.66521  ORF Transcript_21903/g.66521 Transcript_21903/m.66521 type:complete len:207 (+) Transcript_21903:2-622(+)